MNTKFSLTKENITYQKYRADSKRSNVTWFFDVKHDGRKKARLVGGGHPTVTPIDSVYSGVVSLRGFRMCLFLADLNNLEAYTTDIGNAYLEAYTKEKIVIRAGDEFGDQAGHLLIVSKSLYGLFSSSLRFNELLAKCLSDIGFHRSKCEANIWIRDKGDHYEYECTYVDYLLAVSKNCSSILSSLQSDPYNFKLKGTSNRSSSSRFSAFEKPGRDAYDESQLLH